MKLQNPSKRNSVKPDNQFQQIRTGSKRYFALRRRHLVSVLRNTQKSQNSASRKPARLQRSRKINLRPSHMFFEIGTIQGRQPEESSNFDTKSRISLCGCHKNYPRCNLKLITYILELGQCLECLNRRPVSYYNLDNSF